MTNKYLELAAGECPMQTVYADVLGFVVGGLLSKRWARGEWMLQGVDACNRLNVEDVFNALEMLAGRDCVEAAPFIAEWQRDVERVDKLVLEDSFYAYQFRTETITEEYEDQIDDDLERMDRSFSANRVQMFTEAVNKASRAKGSSFALTRAWMVSRLARFTCIETPDRTDYLRQFVAAAHRSGAVIASLNYDNAIELACSTEGIRCNTMVHHWSESFQLTAEPDSLELLKLHGSITWLWTPGLDMPGSKPACPWKNHQCVLERMNKFGAVPMVVFGRRNKLTHEGPFLDLLNQFKRRLFERSLLHVVGYSFSDSHINAILARWLCSHGERSMFVHDPNTEGLFAVLQDSAAFSPSQGRITYHTATDREVFGSLI